MTDKKLTPRIGDRVLVKIGGRTYVGVVDSRVLFPSAPNEHIVVIVDGRGTGSYSVSDLTVVDRPPVEWPEGWEEFDDEYTVLHGSSNVALTREALRDILATGLDMLARWDELMGGAE